MQEKNVLKGCLRKLIFGGMGFLVCMVNVMGYYPLIPAYYAAYCMKRRRNIVVYGALGAGIFMILPFVIASKYVFVLLVIFMGIRFYMWANRRCSGIAAGVIAGAVVVAMNLSGGSWVSGNKNEIVLGIGEGMFVIGLTVIFHFMDEMLDFGGKGLVKSEDEDVFSPVEKEEEQKLVAFVSAIDGLSDAFKGMGNVRKMEALDEVKSLEQELTGKVCANCEVCAVCWNENRTTLSDNFKNLIAAVMTHQNKREILRTKYIDKCKQYPGMVDAAIQAFGRIQLNQAWYKRLTENRQIIAEQLDAMAGTLTKLSQKEKNIDRKNRLFIPRIRYEAREKGLIAENIHLYEDENERIRVEALISGQLRGGIPVKYFAGAVEKAMGIPMRVKKDTKSIVAQEAVEVTLYEATSLYAISGVATQKKNGSSVSGDNFTIFEQDNGKFNVGVSDGMGSGSSAAQESEMVVDLLEKFIEAGFEARMAIRLMNSALVMQGENNSYSTLDYASIDLYTGELELIKIGAAATFIKGKDKVIYIESDTLPAGAEYGMDIKTVNEKLEHGDFLVMVTDGVLEYLHAKKMEDKLAQIISNIETNNAGVLAKEILDQVLLTTGGYAMDDMTVIVVGVWEK